MDSKEYRQLAQKTYADAVDKQGVPYWRHPCRVAETLDAWELPDHVVLAGVLHDAVEDGHMSLQEVTAQYGADVAALVDAVTRREGEPYLDFVQRVCSHSLEATYVKLADVTDNLRPGCPASLRRRYHRAIDVLAARVAGRAA